MVDPGLCQRCAAGRPITSGRGSVFWRCAVHDQDPHWPKYPRLPVLRCARYTPASPAPA
jgi:hypothetical protein